MDWQTIKTYFSELAEDYSPAEFELICFIEGKTNAWGQIIASFPGNSLFSRKSNPSHSQTLWPPETDSASVRYAGFYGPDEPKQTPILKLGCYQTIELWGYSAEAHKKLIDLMRNAGVELSEKECERANIPAETLPELRWVFWILYALRNHRRGFVTQGEHHPEHCVSQRWESVRNVCKASIVAIDEAGLLKPSKSRGVAKITREEANIKAREYLAENPLATARELAEAIGCSLGLVSKLTAWRAVAAERKRGAKPKAVAFTPELQQLIADQHNDDEGSPLASPHKIMRSRSKV